MLGSSPGRGPVEIFAVRGVDGQEQRKDLMKISSAHGEMSEHIRLKRRVQKITSFDITGFRE